MTSFDERGAAFEAKFAHDAELQFNVRARRNKLLGLWAADLLGKTGDDTTTYAAEVVKSDFEEAGDEDVYRKLAADLGSRADESAIRKQMAAMLVEAKSQVLNES
jgi:hypothetical protein